MDKFVTVVKPSTVRRAPRDDKERSSPYERRTGSAWRKRRREDHERFISLLLREGAEPSSSTITKHLLRKLSDEANPITQSAGRMREDHVSSTATGHQRSETRIDRTAYLKHRGAKWEEQKEDQVGSQVLVNVRLYINGFLNETTDIEFKRLVTLAGATHVVTSRQLSGSKTDKVLHTLSKTKVHVVRPEWVTDSIQAGIRKPEREYHVSKCVGNLDGFVD